MQTVAGAGGALRRVSRREARALRRIGVGLVLNLVLAFAWLLVDPLQYTDRTKVAVVVVYFATFVLADTVTTNMLADQTRIRAGRPTGFWGALGVVASRNATLLLALGVPLLTATSVLVLLGKHPGAAPAADAAVLLQVCVWLGISSILASLFPVATASPLAWWRDRRNARVTGWRVFAQLVPYAMLWFLVPADGSRRRLPGMGAVHRRTPGAHGISQVHQVIGAAATGLAIWAACIVIGAAIVRRRGWRPRA